MPGSMGARLADLAKARLFALGAEPPHFRIASPGADATWRIGCQGQWSAFGRPCEGAVVCAWGGDPAFLHGESVCRHHLEGRVRGAMGARLADLAKAWLFALGAAWVPGSMEARLADLAKARLFALCAGTPHFCMISCAAPMPVGISCRAKFQGPGPASWIAICQIAEDCRGCRLPRL